MVIFFLSHDVDKRNTSLKQYNFCTPIETGMQGGVYLDKRLNGQWDSSENSNTKWFTQQYGHLIMKQDKTPNQLPQDWKICLLCWLWHNHISSSTYLYHKRGKKGHLTKRLILYSSLWL